MVDSRNYKVSLHLDLFCPQLLFRNVLNEKYKCLDADVCVYKDPSLVLRAPEIPPMKWFFQQKFLSLKKRVIGFNVMMEKLS